MECRRVDVRSSCPQRYSAESYQQNVAVAMREEVRCVVFQPRRCRLSMPRELRYDDALMSEGRRTLEDTCYDVSSLTNQSIASSRVLNLWNSRWEKVFSAS